ncbi:MAG: methyltransferase domain-containing protein [Pseudomonadota bacterium]|nr:methyltransferase domain-containing protein [Pseudomonadota bacterium]
MTSAPRAGDAIAYHETLAAGWSGRYAAGGFKRRADFFSREVLPRLAPRGEWLDVGCGSGVFSRLLARGGAEVLGLDGSPAMVEAARGAGGAGVSFEVGRVEEVGALARTFDGAICLSVLEYLAQPDEALAAIAGRVKPGGRIAVSLPNRGSTLRLAQRLARGVAGAKAFAYLDSSRHLWTRAEAARLAQGAGLEVEATLGFDPVAPRALWPAISPSLWFLVARRRG